MSMARLCGCAGSSEPSLVACARGNSHELIRFVKHDKNILVCASVRTCDESLDSFNVFNLLPHNTVS